jgi:flagellin FlaB
VVQRLEEVKIEGITLKGRFGSFHRGEKGITGLETAIILIAFVTVAAVLAYSVLSAGIFSASKGQQAVYSGLNSAKASMELAGGVIAEGTYDLSLNTWVVTTITFQIHSVLADDAIDMGKTKIDYTDKTTYAPNIIYTFEDLNTNSATVLSPGDLGQITIQRADVFGTTLVAYDTFTLELIPATGAAVTIERTLPGQITPVLDLH